ncbi:MAG TPA: hypothetical protein ENH82_13290 [bacterium]|nr:hypothetical protein [bacterium]
MSKDSIVLYKDGQIKLDKNRKCFNCLNREYCFAYQYFDKAVNESLSFLNFNSSNAPQGNQIIFTALASCCMKYQYCKEK